MKTFTDTRPANSIDFTGYSFRDFTSTGIEDKSKSIQLTILDNNVVVENNFVAQNITAADSIEANRRVRTKILDVVGSALFSSDTLMLGRLTTQGTAEFKGDAVFTGNVTINNLTDVGMAESSLHHTRINWEGFKLAQDLVAPGTIKEFKSQGILDDALNLRLTINDEKVQVHTSFSAIDVSTDSLYVSGRTTVGDLSVVENLSVGGDLTFQNQLTSYGTVTSHGKLVAMDGLDVRGTVELPDTFKDSLIDYMTGKLNVSTMIPEDGSLTIGGKNILDAKSIGVSVTESNLRKVGTLRELVVAGETVLANKIYASPLGRLGINTEEPTSALDVWDDEVQITVKKHKAKTGWIGTNRDHSLDIGVNSDAKIQITQDKTVIKNPQIGNRTYTEGASIPGVEGAVGDIHWNSSPDIGKPVGWICLGGTRWAKFGDISE